MATITVLNTDDSGAGSLRQAVLDANANADADTIVFAANMAGQTITLGAGGQLALSNDVTINGDINGDRRADVTISGGGLHRIFSIGGATTDVDLASLTLTNGSVGAFDNGGAIFVNQAGSLDLTAVTISGSQAGTGGAISSLYTTTRIYDSLITGNSSGGYGGGIHGYRSNVSVTNSTIHANTANANGGGASVIDGSLTLLNSTVTGNRAEADGGDTGSGGGIDSFATENNFVSVTVNNSVVADNISGNGSVEHDVFGSVGASNSVFGTNVAITGGNGVNTQNAGDLGLGALADNGGPVNTRDMAVTSILRDAGSNALLGTLTTDGNGNDRTVGASVDVGTTEFQLVVTSAADELFNGGTLAAEIADGGGLSLREALAFADQNADADTITFAQSLAGQTLVLGGGGLAEGLLVQEDVTIDGDVDGDDKADIILSGNNTERIFTLSTANTDLLSLTLVNGRASAGYSGTDLPATAGGAILVNGGTLDFIDSTITGSTAVGLGGAIAFEFASVRIINAYIGRNVAGSNGGGLYGAYSDFFLTNTTLVDNSAAGLGGGVSLQTTGGTITSSTLYRNRADSDGTDAGAGGGIGIITGSDLTVTNSIVSRNRSGQLIGGPNAVNDVGGTLFSASFNLFSTDVAIAAGSGNGVTQFPNLRPALDNGGTVLTISPSDNSLAIGLGGNVALLFDIHDIDNDGDFAEVLPLDARGDLRIRNGSTDAGAVEQKTDETIGGTEGGDVIDGGQGNDILNGRGGADALFGGPGDDALNGDAGSDSALWNTATGALNITLSATGSGSTGVVAGIGNDTFTGIENIFGGSAGDTLIGNGEANGIQGLGGNDVLAGGGNNDRLDGFSGIDTVSYAGATGTGVTVNLSLTVAQLISATEGSDTLLGIENIIGSALGDTLTGNDADNSFRGGLGSDSLTGGNGLDTADWSTATAAIVFTLGATGNGTTANVAGIGIDTLAGIENLIGGSAIDTLTGNAQANTLRGKLGNDTLNGAGGIDTADWSDATGAIVFTLSAVGGGVTALVAGIGQDTISNMENLTGGSAGDSLTGNGANNVLDGRGGRDTLRGGGGIDTIRGGDEAGAGDTLLAGDAGADRMFGGGGNDRIDGGADGDTALNGEAGNDTITGGDGDDQADGGADNDIVYGQAGRDTLRGGLGVDTLYGGDEAGAGDALLSGDGGNDHVQGGLGDDRIDGGTENDKLFGEAGNDVVTGGAGIDRLEGGADTDVLHGQDGADVMLGGNGNDTLLGGIGSDRLYGGADDDFLQGDSENDNLYGGAGLDRFNFDPGNGSDAIFDFTNDQDTLVIDPGFGFANAAAVVAATIQTGNHARILLPGANTDIFLWDYLAPGSGNTIGNLIDDILIA